MLFLYFGNYICFHVTFTVFRNIVLFRRYQLWNPQTENFFVFRLIYHVNDIYTLKLFAKILLQVIKHNALFYCVVYNSWSFKTNLQAANSAYFIFSLCSKNSTTRTALHRKVILIFQRFMYQEFGWKFYANAIRALVH